MIQYAPWCFIFIFAALYLFANWRWGKALNRNKEILKGWDATLKHNAELIAELERLYSSHHQGGEK